MLILFASVVSQSSLGQNVIEIPLVVHVVYHFPEDSVRAELIQTVILDSVNADLRRQNLDAIHTQTSYLPIAADTEIEFKFAQVDPDGNPTAGVEYYYTDSLNLDWGAHAIMYDSLGGANPWDECRYFNLWIWQAGLSATFNNQWNGEPIGMVVRNSMFNEQADAKLYRVLTHEIGHFFGVPHFLATPQCVDDGIYDTPIQSDFPNIAASYNNPDSIFEETSCDPIPEGQLAGNYMTYTTPYAMQHMNMFTIGQKERMRSFIAERFPGYIDPEVSCFTSISEKEDFNGFEIYPNPSDGIVNIEAKRLPNENVTLSVRDVLGREIHLQHLLLNEHKRTNLELNPGMYFLTISGQTFSSTEKVIVN